MKQLAFVLAGLFYGTLGCGKQPPSSPPVVQVPEGAVQVVFPASDGASVYADFYAAGKKPAKTIILLFHQAGSNAGEYATTAPQLTKLGYDCLAVDQRSGGNMFHRENRTATITKGKTDYPAAYADLQGAVAWAEMQHYANVVPWGSSYSASLTLRLLSENPKLPLGLVFSPGEYMDEKGIVRQWATAVRVPVFFVSPPGEYNSGAKAIFDALGDKKDSEVISYPGGVHGSSTVITHLSPVAAMIMLKAKEFISKNLPK